MNYFRVIPENFFSVLSSTNKNLYINTAKLIFDKTVEIGVLNVVKNYVNLGFLMIYLIL